MVRNQELWFYPVHRTAEVSSKEAEAAFKTMPGHLEGFRSRRSGAAHIQLWEDLHGNRTDCNSTRATHAGFLKKEGEGGLLGKPVPDSCSATISWEISSTTLDLTSRLAFQRLADEYCVNSTQPCRELGRASVERKELAPTCLTWILAQPLTMWPWKAFKN